MLATHGGHQVAQNLYYVDLALLKPLDLLALEPLVDGQRRSLVADFQLDLGGFLLVLLLGLFLLLRLVQGPGTGAILCRDDPRGHDGRGGENGNDRAGTHRNRLRKGFR